MPITFAVVDDAGNTPADDPKLAAYKYVALLQYQGRRTSLTIQNGRYTVASAGLLSLTFYKASDDPTSVEYQAQIAPDIRRFFKGA